MIKYKYGKYYRINSKRDFENEETQKDHFDHFSYVTSRKSHVPELTGARRKRRNLNVSNFRYIAMYLLFINLENVR